MRYIASFAFACLMGCNPTPPATLSASSHPAELDQSSTATTTTNSANIAGCHVLREGLMEADVLGAVFQPRFNELAEQFQKAMAKEQEWWTTYTIENSVGGKPLPYHPKMGLSKTEYEEFLKLSEQRTITVLGKVKIEVKCPAKDVFQLVCDEPLANWSGLEIDLGRMTITTKVGQCSEFKKDARTLGSLGKWEGCEWNCEASEGSKLDFSVISLQLGRLVDSQKGFFHYKSGRVRAGRPEYSTRLDITFDLPG